MRRFRRNVSVLLLSDRSLVRKRGEAWSANTGGNTEQRWTFVLLKTHMDFSRIPAVPHSPAKCPFPLGPGVRATLGASAEWEDGATASAGGGIPVGEERTGVQSRRVSGVRGARRPPAESWMSSQGSPD